MADVEVSMQKKFKALAEGAGPNNAWCFIAMPFDAAKLWGTRGRIAVKGTINGFPYRTNIQPMEGRHLLTFNKQLQAGAKAKVGDTISVVMERDLEERTVEVPRELAIAFRRNKRARTLWDKLAFTHRKEFAQWIGGGKQEETRKRRAAKALTMILEKETIS
ncbi:MAG: YdeI/OmpD-associated family protein [Chthoniobacterales bacterium]